MTMVRLSELTIGQMGIIEDVEAEEHFRQRLQSLGFRIGKEVRLIRQALFGGPLHVRIGSVNVLPYWECPIPVNQLFSTV